VSAIVALNEAALDQDLEISIGVEKIDQDLDRLRVLEDIVPNRETLVGDPEQNRGTVTRNRLNLNDIAQDLRTEVVKNRLKKRVAENRDRLQSHLEAVHRRPLPDRLQSLQKENRIQIIRLFFNSTYKFKCLIFFLLFLFNFLFIFSIKIIIYCYFLYY
jgi:hypothetical protein